MCWIAKAIFRSILNTYAEPDIFLNSELFFPKGVSFVVSKYKIHPAHHKVVKLHENSVAQLVTVGPISYQIKEFLNLKFKKISGSAYVFKNPSKYSVTFQHILLYPYVHKNAFFFKFSLDMCIYRYMNLSINIQKYSYFSAIRLLFNELN